MEYSNPNDYWRKQPDMYQGMSGEIYLQLRQRRLLAQSGKTPDSIRLYGSPCRF